MQALLNLRLRSSRERSYLDGSIQSAQVEEIILNSPCDQTYNSGILLPPVSDGKTSFLSDCISRMGIVETTNINVKFKKVLLLSASAGAGHVRAAQALERAFIDLGAAEEVRHIDALEYTNKLFRNLYTKAYLDLVNTTPELFGWLYDRLDK